MDYQHAIASSTSIDGAPNHAKKIMCIKCAHSFQGDEYENHYESCIGKIEKYYYVPGADDKKLSFIKDIDLCDFPINRPSVQLSNIEENDEKMIELKITANHSKAEKDCCFCGNILDKDDTCVILPCQHLLHAKCVKKWLVIVDPCKICCDDCETIDTSHTDGCHSLKGSI